MTSVRILRILWRKLILNQSKISPWTLDQGLESGWESMVKCGGEIKAIEGKGDKGIHLSAKRIKWPSRQQSPLWVSNVAEMLWDAKAFPFPPWLEISWQPKESMKAPLPMWKGCSLAIFLSFSSEAVLWVRSTVRKMLTYMFTAAGAEEEAGEMRGGKGMIEEPHTTALKKSGLLSSILKEGWQEEHCTWVKTELG